MKKSKNWETPPCAYCGSLRQKNVYRDFNYWMSPGKFNLVSCRHCGLVFLSPRPSAGYMDRYYDAGWYWGEGQKPGTSESKLHDRIYKDVLIRLKKKKGIRVLDVGAGTGELLNYFKNKNWETYGTETSVDAVKYADKTYGIKLKKGDILKILIKPRNYDVVTMNGVLEHMHRPLPSLIKIKSFLNQNGMIFLSVPNFGSLGSILFGTKWYALQAPTHLYLFTPDTILKMLKKSGFKNVDIKYSSFEENKYILYESLRIKFSKKFTAHTGKIPISAIRTKSKFSLKLESGKLISKIASIFVAFVEMIFGKGELMYVYAKK